MGNFWWSLISHADAQQPPAPPDVDEKDNPLPSMESMFPPHILTPKEQTADQDELKAGPETMIRKSAVTGTNPTGRVVSRAVFEAIVRKEKTSMVIGVNSLDLDVSDSFDFIAGDSTATVRILREWLCMWNPIWDFEVREVRQYGENLENRRKKVPPAEN